MGSAFSQQTHVVLEMLLDRKSDLTAGERGVLL